MLRQRLNDDVKTAMKARDQAAVSALRMILAALKDRDIAARPSGVTDGIKDPEIVEMLQKMVKQRQESIELYKKGGRQELDDQEQGEIETIEGYMPQTLSEAVAAETSVQLDAQLGAKSIKCTGRHM